MMRLEMEKKQEKMQAATPDYHQAAQTQHQQWRVPAQNMSMVDFNLLCGNAQAGPAVPLGRTVQPESLDLHYAYRDDYNPSATYPNAIYEPCSYPSTSAAPFLDPATLDATAAPVPYDTGHYPVHSYVAPETRIPAYDQYGHYETQPQPPPKSIETPPVGETQNCYINLGVPVSSPSRMEAINSLLETNRLNTAPLPANDPLQQEAPPDATTAATENLSEIIKNSIVETVSV